MNCPSNKIIYSYPWNNKNTAYSTELFDFSGSLAVTLTFINKSGKTLKLRKPQVWTTEGLPPDEIGDPGLPFFKLIYTPPEVIPEQQFTIQGIVDLSTVKSGSKHLTFRPQTTIGSWFGDVENVAPVVSNSFICLPEQTKSEDIELRLI